MSRKRSRFRVISRWNQASVSGSFHVGQDYYLKKIATSRKLEQNSEFNTEVTALDYDDDSGHWTVQAIREGRRSDTRVNVVVSAVGQLNRPRYPDIPGREDFRGASMHSARWDPEFDPTGKRVAIIGTGASAFQIVPEIAGKVDSLDVYQRSAPWIFPTANYHDAVNPGQQGLLRSVPYYACWYRFWMLWNVMDAFLPVVTVDPTWPHLERSANATK